jgi:hypothetical protein
MQKIHLINNFEKSNFCFFDLKALDERNHKVRFPNIDEFLYIYNNKNHP